LINKIDVVVSGFFNNHYKRCRKSYCLQK